MNLAVRSLSGGATVLGGYLMLRGVHSTVLSGLQMLGESHPINGENPISFCNLFFFSSLLAGIIAIAQEGKSLKAEMAKLCLGSKLLVAVDACLGYTVAPLSFYLTLAHMSVSLQTLLFSLVIPVSAVMARIVNQQILPKHYWISTALIGAGVIPLAIARATDVGTIVDATGLIWAVVAIASYSASSVTNNLLSQKKISKGILIGVESLAAAIVFGLIALFQYGPHHFLYLEWWWVLSVIGGYAILLPLGIRYLFVQCNRLWSVATVGSWSSLCVPIAIGSAATFLGQPVGIGVAVGSLLTVAGVAIANRRSFQVMRRQIV
jgi:drug/metabolite transporter (DMT)-like permease